MKDTISVRKQGLDKFYTNANIVDLCLSKISTTKYDIIIEPSAGNGSFLKKLPNDKRIGIDIEPEDDEIIKEDFITYKPPTDHKHILVIGNPPFGKNSSLAIQFFNHASTFAKTIAFIIPRTFRKVSVQNRLNLNFHLKEDIDIPQGSFTPNMAVKTCFQIWKKRSIPRVLQKLPLTHKDWNFIPYGKKDEEGQPTVPDGMDFALRAYGGNVGEIVRSDMKKLRPKSWHFIKANIDIDELIKRMTQINFTSGHNSARQNSIGKAELVSLYNECH